MTGLDTASTFTIAKHPPKGGRYVVFCPVNHGSTSPYDRLQFFGFVSPPAGFDEDVLFESTVAWTLNTAHIVETFFDHRDDMPIFTIIEKKDKYCRLTQVGGERQVRDISRFWFSVEMFKRAIAHGTLELLS